MLLDIHSHHSAPYPQGVVSIIPDAKFTAMDSQKYSIGLHPWHSADTDADAVLERIRMLADRPWVAAIGECGVDPAKGAPMFRQMLLFRQQVEIAEIAGKPMVIHAVKSPDVIIGVRNDLKATREWAIHGFRSKPSVAEMYLRAGLWLSYGPRFNADALRATPPDRILAETDADNSSITDVLAIQAGAMGMNTDDYTMLIADNTARFLGMNPD